MGQWLAKLSIKELGPQYVNLILSLAPQSLQFQPAVKRSHITENATQLSLTFLSRILSRINLITPISLFAYLQSSKTDFPSPNRLSSPQKVDRPLFLHNLRADSTAEWRLVFQQLKNAGLWAR